MRACADYQRESLRRLHEEPGYRVEPLFATSHHAAAHDAHERKIITRSLTEPSYTVTIASGTMG